MIRTRLRVGVVGCGDVFHRHYLPALERMAPTVELVAACSRRIATARRGLAAASPLLAPRARAFDDLEAMLASTTPDAVLNLAPPAVHAAVTTRCLEAGAHVYSEKPLATTLAEAAALVALVRQVDRLLLCAPGSAATRRVRWLAEIVASGRYGPLTLAVGQQANLGPAAWREYAGDAAAFYAPGVGPLFDHGVYRLHEMTALLGPVRRVQAMASIAIPSRPDRSLGGDGRRIDVTTPDHVLVQLEFARGGLGQLLASFAVPASRAPWLELHFRDATLSFGGDQWDPDCPASLLVDDGSAAAAPAWVDGLRPSPPDELPVIGTGLAHFVDCVVRGERPLLTAEHARHVLDVMLKAYASIADGRAHDTETGF